MSRTRAGSDAAWRHPAQVTGFWEAADAVDPRLLRYRSSRGWWDTLAEARITLLVTREYEHLAVSLSAAGGRAVVRHFSVPHPSGVAVDRQRRRVYLASTRNPNQVIELRPARSAGRPLLPTRSWFHPGSTYLHDLALIGGELHANATGRNTVVRLDETGAAKDVWWPRCVEDSRGRPRTDRNHLQLNSIAAGATLSGSCFTASTDRPSRRRPGHPEWQVDGRGVVFDGETRQVLATGLTRPHSARLDARRRLWVLNSGYGEIGRVNRGEYRPLAGLGGWTRGLCIRGRIAFVGTSRVLPRFSQYAPGLDAERARCGVHAIDLATGASVGSITWPHGDQVFAVDWLPVTATDGFPDSRSRKRLTDLYFSFERAND